MIFCLQQYTYNKKIHPAQIFKNLYKVNLSCVNFYSTAAFLLYVNNFLQTIAQCKCKSPHSPNLLKLPFILFLQMKTDNFFLKTANCHRPNNISFSESFTAISASSSLLILVIVIAVQRLNMKMTVRVRQSRLPSFIINIFLRLQGNICHTMIHSVRPSCRTVRRWFIFWNWSITWNIYN